jgi:uncharacterized protein
MSQTFWVKYVSGHDCHAPTSEPTLSKAAEELTAYSAPNISANELIPKFILRNEMAISVVDLEAVLRKFVTQSPEIQGAVLASPDGLTLASSLPEKMEDERVSAMSAAILSLGERITQELIRGTVDRLYLEGNQGTVVLTSCGADAVLLVLAAPGMKQGILLLEIKRVATELREILK